MSKPPNKLADLFRMIEAGKGFKPRAYTCPTQKIAVANRTRTH